MLRVKWFEFEASELRVTKNELKKTLNLLCDFELIIRVDLRIESDPFICTKTCDPMVEDPTHIGFSDL